MNINKAENRDKKRFKKKNGMKVDGKSIFTIVKTIVKNGKNK